MLTRQHSEAGSTPTIQRQTLLAYAAARAVSLATMAVCSALNRGQTFASALRSWDGALYLNIVGHGYPSTVPTTAHGSVPLTAAFFPLFPLTVRAISSPTHLSPLAVAVAVNAVAGAVAAVIFVSLCSRYYEPAVVRRAALLFVLFPGAAVLSLAYAEGLLLAFATACLLALHDRRWLLAGVTGGLATATRPIAIALLLPACYAAWTAGGRQRRAGVLAAAGIPVGIAAYLLYLYRHTGSASTWFHVERLGWNQHLDFGTGFGTIVRHPHYVTDPLWDMYLVGFALLALVVWSLAKRARLPPLLALFSVGVVAQCLLDSGVGPRLRFLLTAFPLFLLPVQRWSRSSYRIAAVVSAVGMVVATAVFVRPGFVAP